MPGMSTRRILRGLLAIVLSVAGSAAAVLLVLEVVLRFSETPPETPGMVRTHPQRGHELRPNFRGKTFGAKVEINSYGLRDYERDISSNGDAFRVAVFGDSMTFGIGVEMEETFPKLLERRLNESYDIPVQVFNFGTSSYTTVAERLYLEDTYDRFKPHLVIVEFTAGNDTALTVPPGAPTGINHSPVARWFKDLFRYLYSYNWLAARYYNFQYRRLFQTLTGDPVAARVQHDEMLYREDFQGWIEAQEAFRGIAEFCRARNIPVVFAIYANNIRLSGTLETDAMFSIIQKIAATLHAKGIRHVVLLDDAFRRYAGEERQLWVRPDNSHFSPLAHRLVAEKLLAYLQEKKLIDRSVAKD